MSIKIDLHKNIGSFNLNVQIESSAKRIGILGASGSGKSMTLRGIAGIEKMDSGLVQLGDRVLYDSASNVDVKTQNRNVGYMFQNYALFPTMTAAENIGVALKCGRDEKCERVAEMIRKFNLEGLENRLPSELSGGQQQRVALARIMIYKPEMILLDEPYSALDVFLKDYMQHEVMELLDDYDGQIIMVSHSQDELYRFAEELFVIKWGEIITSGKTRDVFDNPVRVEAAKMTGCKNFSDFEVIDSHTIRAIEWGASFQLEQEIPEGTNVIGYRAQHFIPAWDEPKDNFIKVKLDRIDELPFQKNYYFVPEGGTGTLVHWTVQGEMAEFIKEKGIPAYLRLEEKRIMLLR